MGSNRVRKLHVLYRHDSASFDIGFCYTRWYKCQFVISGATVAAGYETRYHESGHAVAALALKIGLCESAIVLKSHHDAWVQVLDQPSGPVDEDWYIRRAAVKLSGPIAMMRLRGQQICWDTLRLTAEYVQDYDKARQVFQDYWRRLDAAASEVQTGLQLHRSADLVIKCVDGNSAAIKSLPSVPTLMRQFSRS